MTGGEQMVKLHTIGGKAKTSYGVYVSKGLIERVGWDNSHSLRVTAVEQDLILITPEQMPTEQWIELYDVATPLKRVDEMSPTELITLLEVSEGEDGRRPSNLTSLAQLGASGHRIVITNAVNRLELDPGEAINREVGMDVVVLVPEKKGTESVKQRVRDVLDVRAAQVSG
jgi:hypothetical protein